MRSANSADTEAEHALLRERLGAFTGGSVPVLTARHWAEGGAGAEELARIVAAKADLGPNGYAPLYRNELSLAEKIETVGREIYRAAEVHLTPAIRSQLKTWEDDLANSTNFLDAGKFPTITVASTAVEVSGERSAKVTGEPPKLLVSTISAPAS